MADFTPVITSPQLNTTAKGETENSPAQIFTKFDDNAKNNNIEGLQKTYLGVLLLTELNTPKLDGIKEKIESLITGKETEKNIIDKITVDGVEVEVTLTKTGDDTYSVKFAENNSEIDIKDTDRYTTKDLFALCAQHELTISKDKKGESVFSVGIKGSGKGKSVTIGGPDKISVFLGVQSQRVMV